MNSVQITKTMDKYLSDDEVTKNVKSIKYRYGLTSSQALELERLLKSLEDINEYVQVLEEKLMEFTVEKGKPSRQEFEDVNLQEVSDCSV